MKRKFKLIVPSFLTLIFCLLLIAGSTFAIFSSQDQASIEVTSGKVHVTATLTNLAAFSAEATDEAGDAGSATAFGVTSNYKYVAQPQVNDANHYGFATGGTAALENNVLSLNNIVPGDKVTLTLHIVNDSTVKIKYRVRVNVLESTNSANSLKLLEGLVVKVNDDRITNINNVNNWETTPNAGDQINDLSIQVYLPIDAGNDYQDLSTELHFTLEAVQANAKTDDLLEEINGKLKLSDQVNKTMHDAVVELSGTYNLGVLSRYLWDSKSDLFFDESTIEGFDYQYFQVLPAMPAVQKYSIYAGEGWTATKAENLTVGFDAGNTTGITNVSYVRTGDNLVAREVLIRTNSASTAIEVNAPKDVVHHYGLAGSLNIIAVAGQSYHEFGNVLFLQVSKGRVALEETSKVQQIHLSTTTVNVGQANEDEVFDNIVIAKASSVEMPQFSRDPVSIPKEGKLVVALQSSTEEEAEKDYVWLTAIGVYEQVTVSESNTEAGNIYATQTSDAVQQKAAQEIANNITTTIDTVEYTVKAEKTETGWDYKLVQGTTVSTEYAITAEPVVTVSTTVEQDVKTTTTEVEVSVIETTSSQPVESADEIKNGLSNAEKQEASSAECTHPAKYRTYVDVDDTNHKELCTFCGYYELHMHEYDAEDVSKCLKCKHTNQILVNNENAETTNLISIMAGLNDAAEGTYTVELNDGIYLVPLNEMTVSQKNGVNIVFKAKNNAVKVNDKYNYNVILKPNFDKGTIVPRGNNDLFKVSGNSHYGFETLNINNIKFDLSEYTDKIICGDSPDNGRIFAVSCLPGTENRYAHNVTVENCDFIGNTGKRSSAVGANHNNSSPKGITISNCTGKDLNCWFNGYGNLIQISNCAGDNMLCIANFQSDNTSNACFESTGVNIVIENVSGTYFAQRSKDGRVDLQGGTENGVIYSIGGNYLIKNCNITTLRPNATNGGVFRAKSGTNNLFIEGCAFTNYSSNDRNVNDVLVNGGTTTVNGVAVSGNYNLPAYAAKINTTYYTTFADALNAAVADDTIVLLSDISLTSANSLSKSITLDLNGNTITSTAVLFNIYGSNNLTIKDSGENGAINVTNAEKIIYSSGGGLVKIEGGSLVVSGSNTYTYGVLITSGSNFEMTGGSITIPETSTSNYNYCVSNSGSGDIRISGGGVEVKELTASASGGNYAVASSGSGNIYISGGYITANTGYVSSYPYVFAPYAIYNTGSGTAYISGGYIQANGDLNWYIYGNLVEGKAEVTGGLFGGVNYYPVVSSQLAEGHRRFANPDATTSSDYQEVIAQYVILWLDGNGGVLTTDNTKTKAGTYKIKDITNTVSTNIFTRDGYSFMGWNTSADGTGTSYLAGDLIVMDSTITLYAQWVAIE